MPTRGRDLPWGCLWRCGGACGNMRPFLCQVWAFANRSSNDGRVWWISLVWLPFRILGGVGVIFSLIGWIDRIHIHYFGLGPHFKAK